MKQQRYYQAEATEAVRSAFRRKLRGVLVVMATGMGKTVLFVNWAKMAMSKGGRVLVLVDRDVLCDNAADELKSFGMFPVIERGADKATPMSNLVVASIQSMSRPDRLAKWNANHWSLVILDEAHKSSAPTYRTVLDKFKETHNIGVTATPNRPDGKGLWNGYAEIVYEFPLRSRDNPDGTETLGAVEDGWLCRPDFKELPVPITLDDRIATKKSLTEAEESAIFDTDNYLAKVYEAASKEVVGYKSLYFWNSRRTSKDAADYFCAQGIEAKHIDGTFSKKQIAEIIGNKADGIVGWYNEAPRRVLCNCQLLSYGYNQPDIELVGLGKVYKSLTDYLQAIGRGTRVLADVDSYPTKELRLAAISISSKPTLRVIDMAIQNENHNLATPACLVTDDPKELEALRKAKVGRPPMSIEDMKDFVRKMRASDGEASRKRLAEQLANAAEKRNYPKGKVYIEDIRKLYRPEHKPASPAFLKFVSRMGVDLSQGKWSAFQLIRIKERIEGMKQRILA